MRIVGGERRGLILRAPAGSMTRPTSDRARQALFDMLMHASWGGRELLHEATVLDAFAGTAALGLEALSRGAAHAWFMEQNAVARAIMAANIATARFSDRVRVLSCDVLRPPRAAGPVTIAFLDPPYGQDLVLRSVAALQRAGWVGPDTIIVAETGSEEPPLAVEAPLVSRRFGAAVITIWRLGQPSEQEPQQGS